MPLEGAEFTLTGSKGTVKTGISDGTGMVTWVDLPVDETYVLSETKAPKGFSIVAPRNITFTAGQAAFVAIQDDTERHFTVKKIDKQNGSALQGAVFKFEQIDGSYTTTATIRWGSFANRSKSGSSYTIRRSNWCWMKAMRSPIPTRFGQRPL